ncbi:phosphoglucomutase/phosphomannomutase family protein [Clostridium swellfunianum]|uniref:phosphoglucomutase/phosphomannomutase family protein n=1 Tax=Clostridium swellfunianum TaxID=1367462 RepID=UPI00203075A7|nr:phosphoglucomutase/phosphomannomutase family protein [Clostridium swellfunianum]MCM0649538.1 phosphoglucomutase/phosphomannomutase family protein [Clostridium swellfunianum]
MIKFGTGGWRAIIGEEFIASNIRLLSQAIADDLVAQEQEKKEIVIGFDRRFLSDRAAKWASEVFAANGIVVHFIDKISPTPLTMFAVKKMNTFYGIAVTASHNPAEYNGIKVFTKGGRDAEASVTQRLEDIANEIKVEEVKTVDFQDGVNKGLINIINPFNDYIDTILSMIDSEAIKNKGLKILLDPMFGVSKTSLQTILITTRCDLDIINDRHDALFGGRLPSPSNDTLARLKSMVAEKGYDLGIATDGDADRLGVIDDKGNFIHPNEIMVLLYYYLHKYKGWRGPVVRNLATTHLLDRIAESFDEKCYEVPVGFKHISSKMEETDAVIGGESSGGLTIRGHIKGKDGIFAATLLVEMISKTGRSISEMLNDIYDKFGNFVMIEGNYSFSKEIKDRLMKVLFEERLLPDFGCDISEVKYFDGVKVYFKNGGWTVARFSGTEPLLRIFTEMSTEKEAKAISNKFKQFLKI